MAHFTDFPLSWHWPADAGKIDGFTEMLYRVKSWQAAVLWEAGGSVVDGASTWAWDMSIDEVFTGLVPLGGNIFPDERMFISPDRFWTPGVVSADARKNFWKHELAKGNVGDISDAVECGEATMRWSSTSGDAVTLVGACRLAWRAVWGPILIENGTIYYPSMGLVLTVEMPANWSTEEFIPPPPWFGDSGTFIATSGPLPVFEGVVPVTQSETTFAMTRATIGLPIQLTTVPAGIGAKTETATIGSAGAILAMTLTPEEHFAY